MDRRTFLKLAGLAAFYPSVPVGARQPAVLVNDVHSRLNPTMVSAIAHVDTLESLRRAVRTAAGAGKALSVCGGRHAGGGQQFGRDTVLIDTTRLHRVLGFDTEQGLIEVESGIQWPQLMRFLRDSRQPSPCCWTIAQKQTGADHLAVGGTLAANAHGQGLKMKPIVSDVESFTLMDPGGDLHRCSRRENPELFRLVIGGYGLFGIITSVVLRLVPRRKLKRAVELVTVADLPAAYDRCVAAGIPYGDFQVNIDVDSPDYMKAGIFSSLKPADPDSQAAPASHGLTRDRWLHFVIGAHMYKAATYREYEHYYLSTDGLVDWSDIWQASTYVPGYHLIVDRKMRAACQSTEVLTEIYVPHDKLVSFMDRARDYFLNNDVNLIYSTIRFIESDDETFLPWARRPFACVIFNLHTEHTAGGIEHSRAAFRRLIDLAIEYGGSYYLTYHRYAEKRQVLACYPQFADFLRLKRKYDPAELLRSDWYRHYAQMFNTAG